MGRFSLYKIIRIMADAQPRSCCRSIYQQSQLLPVPCQYILSLMNFIINNQEIFRIHIYAIFMQRNKHNLHRPNANLLCFQRSTFYADIKIVNCLPPTVTILKEIKGKICSSLKKMPTYTLLLLYR